MAGSRLKPLTVKEVEQRTAAAPAKIKHVHLGGVPGFSLVHTPSGYKGYALFYRHNGKLKKLTLGSAKMPSLGEARSAAAKHRSAIECSVDPHAEKVKARQEAIEAAQARTPEQLWEDYLTLAASHLRSKGEKDRVFRKHILPGIKKLRVREITKRHVLAILDPIIADGKLRSADKIRQEGAAWFQWLIEREQADRNPFAGLRKAAQGKTIRTRVLSDEEMVDPL